MNVVITDKKEGAIRMNIDNTPRNPGMKRTKFHVQTPQEIRHDLKEAKAKWTWDGDTIRLRLMRNPRRKLSSRHMKGFIR